jgi:hypothetical protein
VVQVLDPLLVRAEQRGEREGAAAGVRIRDGDARHPSAPDGF